MTEEGCSEPPCDVRVRRGDRPPLGARVLLEALTEKATQWFGEMFGIPKGIATDPVTAAEVIAGAERHGLIVREYY